MINIAAFAWLAGAGMVIAAAAGGWYARDFKANRDDLASELARTREIHRATERADRAAIAYHAAIGELQPRIIELRRQADAFAADLDRCMLPADVVRMLHAARGAADGADSARRDANGSASRAR